MSQQLTEQDRATFAGLADVLIPDAEGMPAASQVGVQGAVLDRILSLRPDLAETFLRGIRAAAGQAAGAAANRLNQEDTAALSAIGLVASAAYYMDPKVRQLIGYPGQESRPGDPDETPAYQANGMLQQVIDRGPVFRPTPKA